MVLEKTLENPLDCKEIQPVHPKGDQSWVFFGRTDVEPETPILWPPDVRNWLISKDPEAGKDWRWEEKGTAEDETVGCQYSLDMSFGKLWEMVMDRKAWRSAVHEVAKSRTILSHLTEVNHFKDWFLETMCWINGFLFKDNEEMKFFFLHVIIMTIKQFWNRRDGILISNPEVLVFLFSHEVMFDFLWPHGLQ